ncbi:Uncharacterized protein dnm_075300 [Desulfonema magnum]|uniref:Uncharacterized protein n=1 Tax=Desulfonema magnum TaxID=45655 RepID=A0A975BTR3_9BACT|nr:Uncharacterized protein dnm_075300 [Desulfonema magnum]
MQNQIFFYRTGLQTPPGKELDDQSFLACLILFLPIYDHNSN